MKTPLEVEQLEAVLGARVHGVDLRRPASPELAEDLWQALAKHRVLVLPGQDEMTAEQHIAAAATNHMGMADHWTLDPYRIVRSVWSWPDNEPERIV